MTYTLMIITQTIPMPVDYTENIKYTSKGKYPKFADLICTNGATAISTIKTIQITPAPKAILNCTVPSTTTLAPLICTLDIKTKCDAFIYKIKDSSAAAAATYLISKNAKLIPVGLQTLPVYVPFSNAGTYQIYAEVVCESGL